MLPSCAVRHLASLALCAGVIATTGCTAQGAVQTSPTGQGVVSSGIASSGIASSGIASSGTGAPSGPAAASLLPTLTPSGTTPTPSGSTGPGPTPSGRSTARPLTGLVIALDAGHNGRNASAPSIVNRQVWVGNGYKNCDTSGTETNAGYPEHAFTWDVVTRLAAELRRRGARVVLTRSSDTGIGPCLPERAAVANRNRAAAAISVHADGGPASGRGFHVILPKRVGANAPIIAPSRRLGLAVRAAFLKGTGEPYATYLAGGTGLTARSDLGGLNLSRVPKVFIECGNMRNASDAARLTSPAWRQRAAVAIADGMTHFLVD